MQRLLAFALFGALTLFGTAVCRGLQTEMSRSPTESSAANVMLQLFRMVFNSVSHLEGNEAVLRPFLSVIVTDSIKLAAEVRVSSASVCVRVLTCGVVIVRRHV
jgi:hypothetical protein